MLCSRFPYPPRDGGSIAMNNMIKAFHSEGHEVTVFAMNTPKHYSHIRDLPEKVLERAEYHAVDINTSIKWLDLLANLIFSKQSYHVQRFSSQGFASTLETLLSEKVSQLGKDKEGKNKKKGDEKEPYDFVQLETAYMAVYIPVLRKYLKKAKIVLRAHNIEHEIWERHAANASSPFKQYYYAVTAERIKKFELGIIQDKASSKKVDAIIPVTKRDEDLFKKLKAEPQIFVSGVGLDYPLISSKENSLVQQLDEKYPTDTQKEAYLTNRSKMVYHIGSMDWQPNLEGLDWFLKKVWPKVNKRFPDSSLHLAGRNMPTYYRSMKQEGIVIAGEVEDAFEFMFSRGIMVVPLRSGSGIRVKILEGMAMKRPIVATPIAVEGIGAKHGQHLLIAESPNEFANCLSILLETPSLGETLGKNGAELVKKSFNYRDLAKKLTDFYASLK